MTTTSKGRSYYRTIGSVRGDCGHRHRALSGAIRCLLHDREGCEQQGGYSDREVELVIAHEPHDCVDYDDRGTVPGAMLYVLGSRYEVVRPCGDGPDCWMAGAHLPDGVEYQKWIDACHEAAVADLPGEIAISIDLDD